MPWTEKYRPKKFSEIKGQEENLKKAVAFINNFKTAKKKSLILHGPPGVGKTTLVHVIANETECEIFELNASDLRNKDKLKQILKPAIEQQSLTKRSKIILVDEVDGISGIDRGGLTELIFLINETPYPMLITANDVWSKKLSLLRKKAELIELKGVDEKTITEVLNSIIEKEDILINPNMTRSVAERCKGDLRAAINDLQTIARLKDPSIVMLDERNKHTDIFYALKKIFQEKPSKETIRLFDEVNMPLDEIMLWVEENIPLEYSGIELAKAYDLLSKADLFKGRIYKQQYWRFLVYQNFFLSFGISSAKKPKNQKFTSYKRSTRILKIWLNNQRTFKKKSIAEKYSKIAHIGTKRAMHDFPILKNILKNPDIRKQLKLDKEEIAYLDKPLVVK